MKHKLVSVFVVGWQSFYVLRILHAEIPLLSFVAFLSCKILEKYCLVILSLSFLSSPESVIKRFEQRDHAVDSRGVAEYLRALVVTNAIAEYLPDEDMGKPSSLPSLVMKRSFVLL